MATTKNLPAIRYDIFITAFEKEVAKRQKEIAKIDCLMRPYEIVRTVLEAAKLPNDIKLELSIYGITAIIIPTNKDALGAFDTILASIGTKLLLAGLHSSGEHSTSVNHDYNFEWRLKDKENSKIRIQIAVPFNGTKFIKVKRTKKVITWDDYAVTLNWLPKDQETEIDSKED